MGNIFGNKSSQEDWKKSKPIEKGFTETSNTAQNPPTVNRNAVAAARAARADKTTFKTKLDGADVDDLTNDIAKQNNSELELDSEINEKIPQTSLHDCTPNNPCVDTSSASRASGAATNMIILLLILWRVLHF
jgi:hypothetical protein